MKQVDQIHFSFFYPPALRFELLALFFLLCALEVTAQGRAANPRERTLINQGWLFYRYPRNAPQDGLIYDVRPAVDVDIDKVAADARPTSAVKLKDCVAVLKKYIQPTGNAFLKSRAHVRPDGNPGADFPFVQHSFDERGWELVDLPHDWAIKGPFYKAANAPVGGGMGRLPVQGVGWYRKKIAVPKSDSEKSVFLEVDGAMSYAMVWINGKLAGGWPNGYSSWRVDLTPYIIFGGDNQLAIRLDNPPSSSRWYPGGGIYRNLWLTKVAKARVAQWGTFITTRDVSKKSARIDLEVNIENSSSLSQELIVDTKLYVLDVNGRRHTSPVAIFPGSKILMAPKSSRQLKGSLKLAGPKLWAPLPDQYAHRYIAVTTLTTNNKPIDRYETPFGIREIHLDPVNGLFVNGKKTAINGVNQHADLGSLGMAFNRRAAERQLQMLRELGCNAIRMAHNPPAPELLDLCDQMGFLVVDEIFDAWERRKSPLDFHLIFSDWSEQDLRAMIRRDRNHPSVMMWSFGNEVGEQYTDKEGALVGKRLYDIARDEDPTRPTTIAMNYAKPDMPLPAIADVIGLNYQGEGIRDGDAYTGLKGISTPPMFPAFQKMFPGRPILSTENAAALSSRGEYFFPVYPGNSSPVKDKQGGDPKTRQVSAYELYSVDFGSSADKVFATMARHPFVAGGFVWTGWDYLGEPTPYYSSRSSYFGLIDLAGFKKDRFYLYQSQWRPELPMAHILPHWNWPERIGQPTPVHVFTSGDEAELFLNGRSLGRKKMGYLEYRLRWDEVSYQPGELKVVAYKKGKLWAQNVVRTTGEAEKLLFMADREVISDDGSDLCFVTVKVVDKNGLLVPNAKQKIEFSIQGPGEIIATDNGDATDLTSFASNGRNAFNGLCLVIVKAKKSGSGPIRLKAVSAGLVSSDITVKIEGTTD